MYTPVGFFAAGGIPNANLADFFYDANETSTFVDQSGNSRNGTTSVSSGGSITHTTSGSFTFWNFDRTSNSSRARVDSGYQLSTYSNTTIETTAMVVFRKPTVATTNNTFPFNWATSGFAAEYGVQRNTEGGAPFYRPWGVANNVVGTTSVSNNAWHIIFYRTSMSQPTNKLQIWVDNVNTNNDSDNPGGTTTPTGNIFIGLNDQFDNHHIGAIGYFSTLLSTAQMTELYNYYDALYNF